MNPVRLAVAASAMLAACAHVHATTIYVNPAATGAGTGASWMDAYTDLQPALHQAPAGSQIWVTGGTYYPGGLGAPTTSTFVLRSGVEVYGGFTGTETALAQRDPAAHPTILSGDVNRNDPANLLDNARHVVTGSGADATALLDGFTIRDGYALTYGFDRQGSGGGLFIENGAPTVRRCLFIRNTAAAGDGGAVYGGTGASPIFLECRFEENFTRGAYYGPFTDGGAGGAVAVRGADVQMFRCSFLNNRTGDGSWGGCRSGNAQQGGSGGPGGAVSLVNANATIDGCRFIANSTGNGGVGASCTLNRAPAGSGGLGGAIYISGGTVVITSSLFNANRTGIGGPETTGPSGYVPAGAAGDGSAVFATGASPTLVNGTFVSNTGASKVVVGTIPGNSILWTPGQVPDPMFVNPNGLDGVAGTLDDDFRLQLTSPYIDAGDNALLPTAFALDAAGNPRRVDIASVPDTGAGVPPIIDIGAYETQPCPADFNGSGMVSVQDIFDFLAAYFSSDPRADVNHSGQVSVQDIFDFLALYFAGCP